MGWRRIHAMTDIGESESAVFSPPRSSLVLHGEGPGVGLSVGVSETAERRAPHPLPPPRKRRGGELESAFSPPRSSRGGAGVVARGDGNRRLSARRYLGRIGRGRVGPPRAASRRRRPRFESQLRAPQFRKWRGQTPSRDVRGGKIRHIACHPTQPSRSELGSLAKRIGLIRHRSRTFRRCDQ